MHHHAYIAKSIFGVICALGSIVAASFAMLTDVVSLALIGAFAAIIAAIPPSILAYAALQQAKMNLLKSQAVDAHVAEGIAKTEIVINKATEIHTLTNSNLTAVKDELNVSNERIKGLEELIKAMSAAKTTADDLATHKVNSQTEHKGPAAVAIAGKTDDPTPVIDHQVADLLRGEVSEKLDSIKDDTKISPAE